jgi:hypothetical protein
MAETKYVSTFAMPSEYERAAMEARRRRRMAEMLAAQAYQPQEGGVAPIPTAAPLVQGLQAFLTARQLRKAEEAEQKAAETESEYAKRISGRLQGGYVPDFNQPAAEVPEQTELGEVTLTSQKRPAETLQQYQDRMRTTQFTSPTFDQMLARTPEQTTLEPITPTARYKRSPEEALAMSETDVGMAAMKNRPVLAARLAKLLEEPKTAEFGTSPQYDEKGQAFVVNKAGEIKYLPNVKKPAEQASPTTLARLYDERSKLLPGDPRIAFYDQAIQSEVGSKAPTTNIVTPRDKQQDESRLRDQIEGRLAKMDWFGTQAAMQRIVSAPETPAGDVTIVYALAKANDPTGAVRTDDFDKLAKQGSFGQTVKAAYEEAISGRMLPERRQQLIDTALSGYRMREQVVNKLLSDYQGIAERSGLNFQNVIEPFKPMPIWSQDDEKRLKELREKAAGGKKQ